MGQCLGFSNEVVAVWEVFVEQEGVVTGGGLRLELGGEDGGSDDYEAVRVAGSDDREASVLVFRPVGESWEFQYIFDERLAS